MSSFSESSTLITDNAVGMLARHEDRSGTEVVVAMSVRSVFRVNLHPTQCRECVSQLPQTHSDLRHSVQNNKRFSWQTLNGRSHRQALNRDQKR
jgi:hypothetical protein